MKDEEIGCVELLNVLKSCFVIFYAFHLFDRQNETFFLYNFLPGIQLRCFRKSEVYF